MPLPLTLLASPLALLAPAASDPCTLSTSLTLPNYQALQGAQGELRVQVNCPAPERRYRLIWPGAVSSGTGLELELLGGLKVTVQGAAADLGGLNVMSGPQTLRFAVQAAPGQWGVPRGEQRLGKPVLLEVGQ
ncbi:hypothetical protein Dcar01_01437 [Deinococcus carri]|uniref:Uncharacterized protein n=1 Tax=Deinococcus carri TaxID=1211323 RepID=A0ABP9W5U7_9DEIO